MGIKFANFATSTIADVGGIGTGDVSLNVQPGDGALFPSLTSGDYFQCVLVSSSEVREIVKVTARSTDTFTIDRAEEGTTAAVFAAGAAVELRLTAACLSLLEDLTGDAADYNQIVDKVAVNTTDAQSIGGEKMFTAGLTVTGGNLEIDPSGSYIARILGNSASTTELWLMAGTSTSQNDSGLVVARSDLNSALPGTVSLYGTNGTAAAEGLRVTTDGTVNIPVALQIGGVTVEAPSYTSFSPGGDFTSGTVYISKSGRNVVMTWTALGFSGSSSSLSSATGIIPSLYRPIVNNIGCTFNTTLAYNTSISVSTEGGFNIVRRDWTGALYNTASALAGTVSWVSAS